MKQETLKKAITIIAVALILVSISTMVLGRSDFLNTNIKPQDSDAIDPIRNISGQLLAVVQVIGVAVAVIMLVWLGIKYIVAAPSEKGDIKKGAVVYIVGAILLFGAAGIIQIFKGVGDSVANIH